MYWTNRSSQTRATTASLRTWAPMCCWWWPQNLTWSANNTNTDYFYGILSIIVHYNIFSSPLLSKQSEEGQQTISTGSLTKTKPWGLHLMFWLYISCSYQDRACCDYKSRNLILAWNHWLNHYHQKISKNIKLSMKAVVIWYQNVRLFT